MTTGRPTEAEFRPCFEQLSCRPKEFNTRSGPTAALKHPFEDPVEKPSRRSFWGLFTPTGSLQPSGAPELPQ